MTQKGGEERATSLLNMFVSVLLSVLLPIGTLIPGGIIATFRSPGPRPRSAIQHFAAGTVLAAVAIELLSEVMRQHAIISCLHYFERTRVECSFCS